MDTCLVDNAVTFNIYLARQNWSVMFSTFIIDFFNIQSEKKVNTFKVIFLALETGQI